jgi:hypothetical protein
MHRPAGTTRDLPSGPDRAARYARIQTRIYPGRAYSRGKCRTQKESSPFTAADNEQCVDLLGASASPVADPARASA